LSFGEYLLLGPLGELLIAQALEPDDGFSISSVGAGAAHFSRSSKLGIYIHRKK
jgi:hypothetical protein